MSKWHPLRHLLLATSALVPLGLTTALANPLGGTVVGGGATINGSGTNNVTINQHTDRAIINWQTFNIGSGQSVNFNQPGSSSIALNRVVGGMGPSSIHGVLDANGRVFLVNPNGLLIGRGATINTAGFLATTSDISNESFMSGNYQFNIAGRPDASIVNLGTINSHSHGFAALVAPGVRNSGTITARFGTIGLASANTFSLDFYGDELIKLSPGDAISATVRDVETGLPLNALVKNEGLLRANGGRVELTAAAARTVVDSVINNTGVIEARSVGHRNGKIVLGGSTADNGFKQTVKVSGKLDVSSKKAKGGKIQVTGQHIEIKAASFDASGKTGGGSVLIGGDTGGGYGHSAVGSIPQAGLEPGGVPNATTVSIDSGTVINASATGVGDGGKVIVWADGSTVFSGLILARGGDQGGNGGFVEVSGKEFLTFDGLVNTSAPMGMSGTLLLDPTNFTINNCTGCTANEISVATLQTQLGSNNVVIATNNLSGSDAGDIFVTQSFTWSSSFTLTLNAFRNVQFSSGITVANTGGGHLVVRADVTGTGTGNILFPGSTSAAIIDWTNSTGTVKFFENPTGGYNNPSNFFELDSGNRGVLADNPSQYQYFMLINSVPNLVAFGATNGSNNFALGRDIDATGIPMNGLTFTFSGVFDGLGHTISNLNINGPSALATNAGTIRNLNLTNVTVSAGGNNQFIGLLVGHNHPNGQIINVNVSGTVNGGSFTGITAGGLAGNNSGLIYGSSALVNVTVGSGLNGIGGVNLAGGLAGINTGNIISSYAGGDITAGSNALAGGLVGFNGAGLIDLSWAYGDVKSSGNNVALGGLVGVNNSGARIRDSFAWGDVTGDGTVDGCSSTQSNCRPIDVGGLVGVNRGRIDGFFNYALGNVFVGSGGNAGGIAGLNTGIISWAYATGNVTGAAGTSSRETVLGGVVGNNMGLTEFSTAYGDVGSFGVNHLAAGGAIGINSGYAVVAGTGNVRTGDFSVAGGAVAVNERNSCSGSGCQTGEGSQFFNSSTIYNSFSLGTVTVGSSSIAGGLVGVNAGDVFYGISFTQVTGGSGSILGGVAGVNDLESMIDSTFGFGTVTSTGSNAWVGGFVGLNGGLITNSSFGVDALLFGVPLFDTFGSVSANTSSVVGGFAAVNIGEISNSVAATAISTTGGGNTIGGFTGANFGLMNNDTASGSINATGVNVAGALTGVNGTMTLPEGTSGNGDFARAIERIMPYSTFPVGTINGSSSTVSVSSGAGSTTGALFASTDPSGLSTLPAVILNCDADICTLLNGGKFTSILRENVPDEVLAPPAPLWSDRTLGPPVDSLIQLTNLTPTPPAGGTGGGTPTGSQVPGTPPRSVAPPPAYIRTNGLPSGLPPVTETRFNQSQVLVQFPTNVTQAEVNRIAQQFGLTVLSTTNSTGGVTVQFQLGGQQNVRNMIRALERLRELGTVQPNYSYRVVQANQTTGQATPQAIPPTATTVPRGDPAQYMMGKLHLSDAHRVASGNNVLVAVIDSEVDREHAELSGTIVERFDATDSPARAHSHGTAMAGAIVSRDRLLGVAPGARILAIRAFSESQTSAESTSLTILKSIEWAVNRGARVINMSFAGPYDPSLAKALKDAAAKGVILIAASGNAGPKSPPLWPSADPNVIAVTATDSSDKLFRQANRGPYVSVASPGVEILAPAPQAGYQMSTGTSIATAHVSGIVALMLERDPTLTPRDVRLILEATAADLGPKGRDTQYGWGLVSPQRALAMVDERKRQRGGAATTPAQTPVQR